jgi:hypothetical protein
MYNISISEYIETFKVKQTFVENDIRNGRYKVSWVSLVSTVTASDVP